MMHECVHGDIHTLNACCFDWLHASNCFMLLSVDLGMGVELQKG